MLYDSLNQVAIDDCRGGEPVCHDCNEECRFSRCAMFDTECVESGATDPEAQEEYATKGTCQCLNLDDCPSTVEACVTESN